jgi:DNA-binding LytR/AlgR family response regulator
MVSSIQDLEEALTDTNFMRVDQNIIVNTAYIEGYDFSKNWLYFETAGEDRTEYCYVSRENRTKVKNALMFRRR